MKVGLDVIIGIGGFAVGLIGIGYAMKSRKQIEDICAKLDRSIDEFADKTVVDISDAMVDRAVEKAVEREVAHEVKRAVDATVKSVKNDIHREVKTAVDAEYQNIKQAVTDQIAEQVAKIDSKRLSDEVVTKATAKVVEKFDGNLDDILAKFNHDLDNVSKIYRSIAKTMNRDESKEMVFKIG